MRIKTKTSLIIVSSLVVVVAASVVGWEQLHTTKAAVVTPRQNSKVNDVNYAPPTNAQIQAGEQAKEGTQNATPAPTGTSGQPITVTIVRLGQISPGQNVNLRTTLSDNPPDTSQCVATFTQTGHAPVTISAGIAKDATYYSCEPIDVSPSQLSTGTWQASVYVAQAGTLISNTATGSVVVQQ